MPKENSKEILKNKGLVKSLNHFPVVGIGASAGGLDAFKKLLKAIPENSGMAFVLVQHLDPKHESLLPELLQKVTNIPVLEISDDVKVEPNHIYIIPSNKMMIANDGVLLLSPRTTNKNERNLPIDLFFTSLAEVHQSHSIGVVLSGTASDGTKGLKAIKEHGGITFAQTEESAAFDGMPQSAIHAGVVDFILPPEKIPQKLLEVIKITNGNAGKEDDIPPQEEELFKQMLALLRIRKGTDFTYYKQTTIRRRILRRMALNKSEDTGGYLKFLRENKEEQDVLYQDLLIPVTSFFRDPKSFENLCGTVFPQIIKNKKEADPIRIWVAGCSTGQEVYSMAICLKEFLGNRFEKVQLFATDISEPSILKARTGIFSKSEVDSLSPQRLQEFFTKTNGNYHANKSVRDMCVFAVHNFLKDPPFGKLDLLSCRNVLIYMEPYLQKKALTAFHYALNNHGFLVLGKSETISSVPELFSIACRGDKIFSRKDVPAKYMQTTTRHSEQGMADVNINAKRDIRTDFQKTADDILLTKYTPAGVVVNDAMDIVHFRGKTGNYLEQSDGKPSHNLLKMAKDGLAFELRNILHKAKKEKTSVTKEDIPVQMNGDLLTITIEAIPLPDAIEPHYMVLFHEKSVFNNQSSVISKTGIAGKTKNKDQHLRIAQLEKELSQLREDMRSITEDQEAVNEELQSANEELLSGSEELQSLNEELETGKEELQSTNEELTVVNQEMIGLNEQLTEASNYSETIIATLREPLLVLDKNLRILSANKSFFSAFQVNEKETEGKLIYELGNKQWNIPELRRLLEEVFPHSQSIVDFEVSFNFPNIGHRTMLLNASEIINDKKADKLILISFGDITERRLVEEKMLANEQRFYNLMMQSPFAVALCKGEDMVINLANNSMKELWGKGKNVEGQSVFKLLDKVSVAGYKKILLDVYHTGEAYVGFEHLALLERNGILTDTYHNFVYQPYREVDGTISGIVSIAYEVTEQVLAKQKVEEKTKQLQTIFRQAPALIATVKGPLHVYEMANEKYMEFIGKHDIIGKPVLEVLPEIEAQGYANLLTGVYQTGKPFTGNEIPFTIDRGNGRLQNCFLNFVMQPIPDSNGQTDSILIHCIDVTEQVLSRKKIEESEERYNNLITSSPSAIGILQGENLIITIANDAIIEIWGKGKEIMGKPYFEALPELAEQGYKEVFHQVYTTGNPFNAIETPVRILQKGKMELKYYNFLLYAQRNINGDIDGVGIIATEVTSQALLNKKIKESEEQFSTLAENMENLAWLADGEGFIYWYNKRWYDYTGTTLEDMKGSGWQKVHHPSHMDRVVNFLKDAWHKNQPFELTFPLRGADGEYKWFLTRAYPIADEKGKVMRWIGTNTDITKQRDVQSLLEYRKALLEAHNEASVDGLLLVDARGKIISYNKRFIDIWNMPKHITDGKDDDAALSFAMTQLVNPQQFIEKVKLLYENPNETSIDELEFKDGKVIERHGYPVVAPDGSYYAWSWTFRDITELKRAELVLRQSEEHFRQMAELMPDKISNANASGNITYYNQNWLDYTGFSFEELKDWGWDKIIHIDDIDELKKRWQHSIETGDDFEMELRILNSRGQYKWHLSRSSAVKGDNGKIKNWIAATTEIQGQKEQRQKLERAVQERTKELSEANEELGKMNKELESFAYVSSHDLQEPLRKIQAFASRILEKEQQNLTSTGKDYFNRMQEAAKRMRTLIDDLLTYSRTNTTERKFENTDLNKIIEDVKTELSEHIQEKNVTIEAREMCKASIIPFQFHQLFSNLISNSLKFSIPAKPVHIIIRSKINTGDVFNNEMEDLLASQAGSMGMKDFFGTGRLSTQKKYCHIRVADNGIGFDPQFKDRIFEVFQRLHGKDEYPGTGIGLAIVKKIVENHNGIITASSEPGQGATFDIYIPAE